jgi:hypothetical protein
VDCEATADCEAQASAQASANIACTPPSLEIGFTFNASVDAEAKAAFSAKMAALKVAGVAIVQGFGRMTALIDGRIDGEVVFNPAPLAQVQAEIQGLITAGVEGDLFADIPIGRAECAFSAFSESVDVLGGIATEGSASIDAQLSFVTSLTTGDFSS